LVALRLDSASLRLGSLLLFSLLGQQTL
jgi:hypothetical protein